MCVFVALQIHRFDPDDIDNELVNPSPGIDRDVNWAGRVDGETPWFNRVDLLLDFQQMLFEKVPVPGVSCESE